jgi:aspartyl/asparaginyl-tRNA synthetase
VSYVYSISLRSDRSDAPIQDVAEGNYGKLPFHQSQDDTPKPPLKKLSTITDEDSGKTILFRARLHNSRQQGNKMLFCQLRQSLVSIQGLLELNEGKEGKPLVGANPTASSDDSRQWQVSKQMMKFCSAISLESLVLIEGTVQPVEKEVEATSIKNYEVHISKVTDENH